MNVNLQILIIRTVLGAIFGVVLARFFFPEAPAAVIIALCLVLVGLAYFSEYLRHRKKDREMPQ